MSSVQPLLIEAREHDIGGLTVRRMLPFRLRRAVGPFVFFDHIGPADLAAGRGMDVRPHPHIGLATMTYLLDGAIHHRDSLGSDRVIRPGDVNWMVAARGIAHSERSPVAERAAGHRVFGVQTWIALPRAAEECAPSFSHHPASTLPEFDVDGVQLRLALGEVWGEQAPARVHSRLFYLAATFAAGSVFERPLGHVERAVHVLDGELDVDGQRVVAGQMWVAAPATPLRLRSTAPARAIVFGGDPLDGERHLWWNFVSSSPARIEQAKRDWAEGRFAPVPGETEFIPLPER